MVSKCIKKISKLDDDWVELKPKMDEFIIITTNVPRSILFKFFFSLENQRVEVFLISSTMIYDDDCGNMLMIMAILLDSTQLKVLETMMMIKMLEIC